MRLVSLEVSGFRAFAREQTFSLDADVVLLSGPNGLGKTSFFDAILWALTGRLPRFKDRSTDIVSLYSISNQARVAVRLEDLDGGSLCVTRSVMRGETPSVLVQTPDEELEGAAADSKILQLFWPSALQTTDSVTAFSTAFTRSVYLQQDLVREFIETDTEETRFSVLSELVGAGRLGEFLRSLESARNAWSRARTERESALRESERRAADVQARLSRLQDPVAEKDLGGEWARWWQQAHALGIDRPEPALGAVDASRAVNEVLSIIQAERRSAERRRRAAEEFLSEWRSRAKPSAEPTHDAERVRSEHAAISKELQELRQALAIAQTQAERERERLTRLKEREAELRSLATLALRHLEDDVCPVCGQHHDVEATRSRLESLAQPDETRDQPPDYAAQVGELATRVAELERRLSDAALKVEQADRAAAEERSWKDVVGKRLRELELPDDTDPARLQALVTSLDGREASLDELFRRGEQLALLLARGAEALQRTELEQQMLSVGRLVEERRRLLALHEQAGEAATAILEAGRVATRDAVDARVQRIEPLVGRIYARMDPHPAFTQVRLGTSYPRGRGRVQTLVEDPAAGFTDKDPYTLFSSSQLNALAVSIFLGLNLGATEAPLAVSMLDDPLQSLDDVNLLGLVDTLRRTKALRQLLVSTHDSRLANLLQRKLRPVGNDRATRVYVFTDWTPEAGPTITHDDVNAEPEEIRVAAA
jgi:DNA repair exonuclease SbcCD ATPase subunit